MALEQRRPRITSVITEETHRPKLPVVGYIKLGYLANKGQANQHPVEAGYFVVDDRVQREYGKEPKELDVFLPSDNLEITVPHRLAWWGKSKGVKCYGDGVNGWRATEEKSIRGKQEITRMVFYPVGDISKFGDDGNGQPICCGSTCPQFKSKDCNWDITLYVFLPRVTLNGVFQLSTHSPTKKDSVIGNILALQEILKRPLQGVPMKLVLKPYKSSATGKSLTHYNVQLELNIGSIDDINQLRNNERLLLNFSGEPLMPVRNTHPDDSELKASVKDEENVETTATVENRPRTLKENWDIVKKHTSMSNEDMLKTFGVYVKPESDKGIVAKSFDFILKGKEISKQVNEKLEQYIKDRLPMENQEDVPF